MRTHLRAQFHGCCREVAVLKIRCDSFVADQPSCPGPKGAPRPTGPALVACVDAAVALVDLVLTGALVATRCDVTVVVSVGPLAGGAGAGAGLDALTYVTVLGAAAGAWWPLAPARDG